MGNGFWGIGIIISVLIVAAFIVLRTTIKRFGIKRKCCGQGKAEKREQKILEAEPMFEVSVRITDLCCEDCAIRIENAFNRMNGVSAKASHEEKRAVLLLCRELTETEICDVVTNCGFTASEVRIKKL